MRRLLPALLLLALPAAAQNRGGFFEEGFATQGFFEEEKVPGTSQGGPSHEVPGTSREPSHEVPGTSSAKAAATPMEREDSFAVSQGSNAAQDAGAEESLVNRARPIADRLREVQERMEAMKNSPQMSERVRNIQESLQRSSQGAGVPASNVQAETPAATPEPEEMRSTPPISSETSGPEVSIFVRGDQKGHFLQAIERALKAKNRFGTRIRALYIVSVPNDLKYYDLGDPAVLRDLKRGVVEAQNELPSQLSGERLASSLQEAATPFVRALHALDLAPKQNEAALEDINKLGISISPTWVVQVAGLSHIFEGPYDPSELFTPTGEFIGAAQFTPIEDNNPNTIRYEGLPGVPLIVETSDPAKNKIAYLENHVPATYLEPSELPEIPRCAKPAMRKQLVSQHAVPNAMKPLDILVFSGENNRDSVRASKMPNVLAVAYHAGSNAVQEKISNPWLSFALTLDIRCLPTRERRIQANGKEYLEHLEGEQVWEQAATKVSATSP